MSQIKILLADDHDVFREALEVVLNQKEGFYVAASVDNGRDAVHIAKEQHIDVAILDVSMPIINGLEATKAIKEYCKTTKVIVLTGYSPIHLVYKAIASQANGCLLKTSPLRHLEQAIVRVHSSSSYFDHISSFRTPKSQTLTNRELDVIRELCRTADIESAATVLELSQETIKTHLKNAMKKTDSKTKTDLVLYALNTSIV